jgi:hypothetical protein
MNASRFRPRFTLATLLLLVAVLAVGLGLFRGAQRFGYEEAARDHARARELVHAMEVVNVIYDVADLVKPAVTSPTKPASVDFVPLVELITSTVSPESWRTNGGPGTIEIFETNRSLVVWQRRDNHDRLERLLKQLRRRTPAAPKAATTGTSSSETK